MCKLISRTSAYALMFGLGLTMVSVQAHATDQDVNATIQTRAAISLTLNTDMDFGSVDYAATNGGTIQLGTDGNVTLNAGVGLTMFGTPTAGSVGVSGDGASIIDISCETGGTLTDGGANTLTLSATEIAIDTGAAFGSGTACAGLGTSPVSVDLSLTANPTVLVGGALDVTADPIDGSFTYSTASAGGDPVTVRVVYQ